MATKVETIEEKLQMIKAYDIAKHSSIMKSIETAFLKCKYTVVVEAEE